MQSRRQLIQSTALAAVSLGVATHSFADALLEAVKADDRAEAHRLLDTTSFDATAAEPDGTTALHYAIERNDLDLARGLIAAGAEAGAMNRYGVSPLYIAALNGNAEIVALLLDNGVDPKLAIAEGETALMTAARSGDVATIDRLIEAGADVNATEDWKEQTALMWAASENNGAAVTRLLAAGADRDAVSAGGEFTALKFAVRAGAIDAVRALLDAGADVDETMQDGTSMLVLAVTNAHYELAGVLLDYGADPNGAAQGWTALHQIAWSRRWNMGFNLPGPAQTGDLDSLDLVPKLVAFGADIDARQTEEPKDGNRNKLDRIGATAFLLAAKSCDVPLMRVLLAQGADPSITTEAGATALMAAAGVGIWAPGENPGTHEEALAAVKLAYEVGGGDINAVDSQGDTALHGAVYRGGAIPVIEFLAARGAKLDAVNEFGWMPVTAADGLEYTPAVLKRYPEAAALLRRLMAEQGLPIPPSTQPGRRDE
jgi:ankyrin repeat protein